MQLDNLPEPPQLTEAARQALLNIWECPHCTPPPPPPCDQDHYVESVVQILRHNLSNGRYHRTRQASDRPDEDLCLYINQVALYYWQQHKTIELLNSRDPQAWQALCTLLTRRAFYVLCRNVRLSAEAANSWAQDYAHEACRRILDNNYPYDVPFNAWATRILYNCIYDDLSRSSDLLDCGPLIDKDWDDLAEWAIRQTQTGPLSRTEDRIVLLNAIAEISQETQRQVIFLTFFCGWSTERIAHSLGKTPQAVYNLRNRAITALKKVLSEQ